jgi:signal transduction histidine kinase
MPRRLGLVPRLAIAMTLLALCAMALSAALVRKGVDNRLERFGAVRLHDSARRDATLAASLYRGNRLTPGLAARLRRLGRVLGYDTELLDSRGLPVGPAPRQARAAGESNVSPTPAASPIVVDGRVVGTVRLTWRPGGVLDDEAGALHTQLDHMQTLSVALVTALAVLAAALVAMTLVRPIRRLTNVAEQIEQGDLGARASGGGGTEIEGLGRAFNRLAETLRREDELRRDAAKDIAHELRTPVAGIVARVEAAQDGVLDHASNLEAMHAEALRLVALIDDVDALAQAQQPELLLARERVDLGALAARRARTMVDFFDAKAITLSSHVAPLAVAGDERRLEQVVDNLLSNALRYTDPGGKVRIRVHHHGAGVALEVSDTGIGMALSDAQRVFERFWRADRSRSRATGGAGIGLAIVRELVRAHDGRVEVDSRVGRGTTFRVVLPAAGPVAPLAGHAQIAAGPRPLPVPSLAR